jgi:predicted DNA-binding transcriptional regulator AlpA
MLRATASSQAVAARKKSRPVAGRRLVDREGLAELLHCSTRHVIRLQERGILPSPVRIGALVRWPSDVIDQWIADGCPASTETSAVE